MDQIDEFLKNDEEEARLSEIAREVSLRWFEDTKHHQGLYPVAKEYVKTLEDVEIELKSGSCGRPAMFLVKR